MSEKCLRFGFFVVLMVLFAGVVGARERPNVVVILCDDLGYGDLACYGHPHIKTPHLDRMAEEGVRLTDMYSAAPVCSPSRVGLMTGRSPNRAGIYDWIPPKRNEHMRAEEVTIAQLLKKAGYATCLSGKWHCNSKFNSEAQPQPDAHGFDHWFATQNNASPSHANPRNFVRNGKAVGEMEGYACQLVMDEAIGWIKGHREKNGEQPFFVYAAFHEPHEPVASPKEMTDGYMSVAKSRQEAEYFANVENLDAATGKLLAALKEMGIDEETLVVFTSDNGPETLNRYKGAGRSYGTPAPLRGMKLWTTEAGFRVCGIMRWPGTIEGGQEVGQVVSSLDFLPTFCALAGAEVPEGLELDGTDFLPGVTGGEIVRERPLVWAFYHAINERRVAMRHGDWKVLAKLEGQVKRPWFDTRTIRGVREAALVDVQIFDLSKDVGEGKDLSGSEPERAKVLGELLEKEYRALAKDSYAWPER